MEPENGQRSLFLRNCSCLATLAALICEYLGTFQFEYQHIWKRPMTLVKLLYLFSRYFGLFSQMANAHFVLTKLSQAPVEISLCRNWFIFLNICNCVQGTMLHIIMKLRIYALYQKDRRVGILLGFIVIGIIGLCLHMVVEFYGHDAYDDTCNLKLMPSSSVRFFIILIIEEIVIWSLTLMKGNITVRYSKMVGKVVRDGGAFFALTIAISIPMIIPHTSMTLIGYVSSWALAIFSSLTCRLIQGFLQLAVETPVEHPETLNSGIELTSFIDLSAS